jgi:hypothetical protein
MVVVDDDDDDDEEEEEEEEEVAGSAAPTASPFLNFLSFPPSEFSTAPTTNHALRAHQHRNEGGGRGGGEALFATRNTRRRAEMHVRHQLMQRSKRVLQRMTRCLVFRL